MATLLVIAGTWLALGLPPAVLVGTTIRRADEAAERDRAAARSRARRTAAT